MCSAADHTWSCKPVLLLWLQIDFDNIRKHQWLICCLLLSCVSKDSSISLGVIAGFNHLFSVLGYPLFFHKNHTLMKVKLWDFTALQYCYCSSKTTHLSLDLRKKSFLKNIYLLSFTQDKRHCSNRKNDNNLTKVLNLNLACRLSPPHF